MKRQYLLPLLLLITLSIFSSCTPEVKPPNVIFIVADDLGWTDLSCYGSTFYQTPNLDKLAAEGVRFTNGYAACPVCSPTRASLMTGKNPVRVDITDWIPGRQHKRVRPFEKMVGQPFALNLDKSEKTLAEAFKENGYQTFFAGKWHLGEDSLYWPEFQGFDINKGGWKRGAPTGKKGPFEGAYFTPYQNPRLEDGPDGEYLTDRLVNESIEFLNQAKEEPFLLYLSFYTVHTPLQAKKEKIDNYEKKKANLSIAEEDRFRTDEDWMRFMKHWRQRLVQDHPVYASMVESMDENIGRLLDQLDALGLTDNTIVVFTSDNGGLSTAEGAPTVNAPLKAGKGWLYEGGIRVPFLLRWPAKVESGQVIDAPIVSHDLYPTVLSLAGFEPSLPSSLDGQSLNPLLSGEPPVQRSIFWHYPHYSNQGGKPGSVIRKGDFKLIMFHEGAQVELYNIKEDISEEKNLVGEMPEKAEELLSDLKAWCDQRQVKYPKPNPDYDPEWVLE